MLNLVRFPAARQPRVTIALDRIQQIIDRSEPKMPLLEIRNLTKVFSHSIRAVDDVSLDLQAGETLGLVGESGSGKSTLGRLILRLIEPTFGAIRFAGRDLLDASGGELRRHRRDMQIIFQDPFSSLDPRMRVEDLIAEPLVIHRHGRAEAGKP